MIFHSLTYLLILPKAREGEEKNVENNSEQWEKKQLTNPLKPGGKVRAGLTPPDMLNSPCLLGGPISFGM